MTTSPDLRYLVIDQGGHASRASLFDAQGNLIEAATAPVGTRHLAPALVEHDPEEMVASVRRAMDEVLRRSDAGPIHAAALATQRSTVVCWDKTSGAALSPVISWQDRRSTAWLQQLEGQAADIHRRTGLPLSPHYGAGKLRWCLDHLPAVANGWRQGRLAWGPLASFLVFRLTEERTLCADPANASRTQLWNLDNGDWDPTLADLFGIPLAALPPCVPTRHRYGHIALLDHRIPLTVVTGDQSAALFAGDGDDEILINLGTGAFLQQAMVQRPPPSRLLASLAYEDAERRVYALEGTVNGAGSALTWIAQRLRLETAEIIRRLPEWLADDDTPPLFLNGVAGLGTPYWVPLFEPRFAGQGSAAAQCVGVIESIVFLLQRNLEEMARITAPARHITLSGGLSRLDGLCQRLADLSALPLSRPADHEASVRGLAKLLCGSSYRASAAVTGFTPRANPDLLARYRQWRTTLDDALAANAA